MRVVVSRILTYPEVPIFKTVPESYVEPKKVDKLKVNAWSSSGKHPNAYLHLDVDEWCCLEHTCENQKLCKFRIAVHAYGQNHGKKFKMKHTDGKLIIKRIL